MVSIQGVGQVIPRPRKPKSTRAETKSEPTETAQASRIAKAVSQGLHASPHLQDAYQQIQYDLPDGKSRQALASYLCVKDQARRDALIALFRVDIFV